MKYGLASLIIVIPLTLSAGNCCKPESKHLPSISISAALYSGQTLLSHEQVSYIANSGIYGRYVTPRTTENGMDRITLGTITFNRLKKIATIQYHVKVGAATAEETESKTIPFGGTLTEQWNNTLSVQLSTAYISENE